MVQRIESLQSKIQSKAFANREYPGELGVELEIRRCPEGIPADISVGSKLCAAVKVRPVRSGNLGKGSRVGIFAVCSDAVVSAFEVKALSPNIAGAPGNFASD